MPDYTLTTLDLVLIAAYFAVLLVIGIRVGRGQHGAEDYFLAGRGMIWPFVGISPHKQTPTTYPISGIFTGKHPLPTPARPTHHGPMPKPRKRLVSLETTPYYHCISRCVRRAFLCGTDTNTGFDFSHRRGWIVERMKMLSGIFAMDIYGYAVMSNHYHIVLRIDQDAADRWTDREVAERWLRLFKGPDIVQRWLAEGLSAQGEPDGLAPLIDLWRNRLKDLSWFMRCLNEYIARLANREDHCSGRFWEGRFKSQALLDERALLACMAYVDLNPIRAGIAKTPEASEFTSIGERIRNPATTTLAPFQDQTTGHAIPFRFEDYLQLVDWSGRAVKSGKSGSIPDNAPPILQRLGMDQSEVLSFTTQRAENHTHALGPVSLLRDLAERVGLKFLKGISLGRRLCPEAG